MGSESKTWSYSAGEWGRNRVRAYEDSGSGIILVEFYEEVVGCEDRKRTRVSLGHRDRQKAKRQTDEMAAQMGRQELPTSRRLTLGELFDIYLEEVTPQKAEGTQAHDRRCAKMLREFFGEDRDASGLNRRDWDRFIHERRRGAVAPKGSGSEGVGNRQIAYDLKFLLAVLNWATLAGDGSGQAFLERNPLTGLPLPKEESPNRPVLSDERYLRMLAVAEDVDMRFRLAFVLAHETGHRIGSIRKLRWSDVDLEDGTVRWRGENDKIGFEHETPLTETAVGALQRAREASPAIGEAFVLPAPEDTSQSCSRHLMRDWWLRAEELAELEHVKGMGWHSLRRKFATEMKHTPLKDLGHLGGWKSEQTILKCYQKADEGTMRAALEQRKRPGKAAQG